MNGLLVTNFITDIKAKNVMSYGDVFLAENMIDKFVDDKLFVETQEFFCGIDGVILNKKDLLCKKKVKSLQEYVERELHEDNRNFYKAFRGAFNGFVFWKRTEELVCFVDHFGNKPFFYFLNDSNYIIGNTLKDVCGVLANAKRKCTINQNAIRDLLTYSFVINNETILSEVKRIPAGCFLDIKKDKEPEISRYHAFAQDKTIEVSEDEAIEEIDRLFRRAVCLEYEKDDEYGYKHFATLSAGMDSRMNNFVADSLGYKDIINCTFAQYDSIDMKTSAEISETLGHKWVYRSLNDANCMTDWERMAEYENGLSIYWCAAHGFQTFELFDWNSFGLYHTGMVGDSIIASSFSRKNPYKGDFIGSITDFNVGAVLVRSDDQMLDNITEEIYFLYQRGFQGANTGMMPEFRFTEVISPFLYVDLVEYCLSLPQKMRYKHNLYFKWVLKKYPNAAGFPWNGTKIKDAINEPIKVKAAKKIHRYKKKIYKKCGIEIKPKKEKPISDGMNPLDFWYENKQEIRKKMDDYYKQGIEHWGYAIEDVEALKNTYDNGLAIHKTICITVLAALESCKEVLI